MKKIACLLLLLTLSVGLPAFADATSAEALPADLSQAATPAAPPAPLFVAVQAYCEATCQYGGNVSCTGSTCIAVDDPNGYVTCDGQTTRCATAPPLSVTIWVMGCNQIGDKAVYSLQANAYNGSGGYNFSWLGANASSGYTVNPNPASTVVLSSKTVQVTVSSGGQSANDSIFLRSPCAIYE